MLQDRKKTLLILFSIILLGISIRIYKLGDKCFWLDEIFTILMSSGQSSEDISSYLFLKQDFSIKEIAYYRHFLSIDQSSSLKNIVNLLSVDAHPPLYLILIHFWRHFFGDSEFAVRLFSALFGFASIPFVYLIGKRIFNRDIALLASAIFTVAPFQIYYSQEARAYSMLTFLLLVSTWAVTLLTEEETPSTRGKYLLLVFLAASVAGLYSHYFYAIALVFQNTFFLIKKFDKKKELSNWLIIQAVLFLGFLPWVFTIIGQYSFMKTSWGTGGQFYDGLLPLWIWVKKLLLCNAGLVVCLSIRNNIFIIIPVTLLILSGALQLGKYKKSRLIILLWGIIPLLCMVVLDLVLKTHFSAIYKFPFNRFMFFTAPPIYFVTALGIYSLYKKNNKIGLGLGVIFLTFLLLSSLFLVNIRGLTKSRIYYTVSGYLDKKMGENDLLVMYPHWDIFSFSYYLKKDVYVLPVFHDSIADLDPEIVGGRDAIWFLITNFKGADIDSVLNKNFSLVEKKRFQGVMLLKCISVI